MWVTGPGSFDITLEETTLSGSHDGLEIAPKLGGAIVLTIANNCAFVGNENGLEIVDQGTTTYSVSDTIFLDQYNREPPLGGTWHPGNEGIGSGATGGSVAAIAERGNSHAAGTLRNCKFANSTYAIITAQDSSLDLGRDVAGQLGNNLFCLDYSAWPSGNNPFRVCLFDRSEHDIFAAGNFWIPANQGSDGAGALLLGVNVFQGENLPNTGQILGPTGTGVGGTVSDPGPPGPLWTDGSPLPGPVLRNYSTLDASFIGAIDFGTIHPGSRPDCPEGL